MEKLIDGVGIITPESAEILGNSYVEGLHVQYDFYMNCIGIGIILVIFGFLFFVFIDKHY